MRRARARSGIAPTVENRPQTRHPPCLADSPQRLPIHDPAADLRGRGLGVGRWPPVLLGCCRAPLRHCFPRRSLARWRTSGSESKATRPIRARAPAGTASTVELSGPVDNIRTSTDRRTAPRRIHRVIGPWASAVRSAPWAVPLAPRGEPRPVHRRGLSTDPWAARSACLKRCCLAQAYPACAPILPPRRAVGERPCCAVSAV